MYFDDKTSIVMYPRPPRKKKKKTVVWLQEDDDDSTLRNIDIEKIVKQNAGSLHQSWAVLNRHPIKAKPERYYLHLSRVTMTLIEMELERRRKQGRNAVTESSHPEITNIRRRWDAFALGGGGGGGDSMENDENRLISWMVRSRLFILQDYDSWVQNREMAKDLVPDEILVYDHAPPIMEYDLSTCMEAMELLLASWREVPLDHKIIEYLSVLKARAVAYSCFVLEDRKRLNRPDMVVTGPSGKHVNLEFFRRCSHTFSPLEQEIAAFHNLLLQADSSSSSSSCSVRTSRWIREETEAWERVYQWANEILDSPRGHSITDRFRTGILTWMVRPGEKIVFQERWPQKDPNPRNIISRLRREDIDRYGSLFLVRSAKDILKRDPKTDEDVPGYCIARNELILEVVSFMYDENGEHHLPLVRPEQACQANWNRERNCVIQIGGSFLVWESESRRLTHCGRRFYSALMEWTERVGGPFASNLLLLSGDDNDQGSLPATVVVEEERSGDEVRWWMPASSVQLV